MAAWFKKWRKDSSSQGGAPLQEPLGVAADDEALAAYERVFAAASAAIPQSWTRTEIHFEYDGRSAQSKTLYWTADDQKDQVFIADELWSVLVPLRDRHWTKGMQWYILILRFTPSGKFSTEFGYEKTEWMKF